MLRITRPVPGAAVVAALLFSMISLAAAASPAPPEPAPGDADVALSLPAPPKPVAAKSVARALARAVKQLGLTTLPKAPQKLEMRVTPMASRLDNGTRITEAAHIYFFGATNDVPDGLYRLHPEDGADAYLKFRVHTEKDKLYVADCRVVEQGWNNDKPTDIKGGKVTVAAPGLSYEDFAIQDGHVLFVFRGADGGASVQIKYARAHPAVWLAFYGCDFGAVG